MLKNSNNWKLVNFYIFIGIFLASYGLFWFLNKALFVQFGLYFTVSLWVKCVGFLDAVLPRVTN